jgi:hypothetical protein
LPRSAMSRPPGKGPGRVGVGVGMRLGAGGDFGTGRSPFVDAVGEAGGRTAEGGEVVADEGSVEPPQPASRAPITTSVSARPTAISSLAPAKAPFHGGKRSSAARGGRRGAAPARPGRVDAVQSKRGFRNPARPALGGLPRSGTAFRVGCRPQTSRRQQGSPTRLAGDLPCAGGGARARLTLVLPRPVEIALQCARVSAAAR